MLTFKWKLLSCLLFAVIAPLTVRAELTLDDCRELAQENYPVIKKYRLLQSTEDLQLSDINRGWLPRIGVYGQGSWQNVVPSFPSTLSRMMEQLGGDMPGLSKLQYKIGADVNQTIWDGGSSKAKREIERSSTELSRAALDVDMYAIRKRVDNLYFGILLIEKQIDQTRSAIGVYENNLERLRNMLANGTAMQSDVDMIEAQQLTLRQQLKQAEAAARGYRTTLALFIGRQTDGETLMLPSAELPENLTSNRPELAVFDARQTVNNAQRQLVNSSVMPRVGFFAQGYYGYPGIDYFKAMTSRDLTFNLLAGVKVQWNIDSFYTKKNSLRKLDIANQRIEADRETFLFNSALQTSSELAEIEGIRGVMADDEKIVALRANVRKAAESQLTNGIIDATALTMKINDETQAQLASQLHKIQYLQAIQSLKETLNR